MQLITLVIIIPFTFFLLYISNKMRGEKSIKQVLDNYEKDPESSSCYVSWFYRFRFALQRKTVHQSIEKYGDKRITALYKITGWIFLIFCIGFIATAIVLIAIQVVDY